jgi:hypothetical protein
MYRTLHEDDLSRAAEAVRLRDALRARREVLAQRLDPERARHEELAIQLRRERKDVARLEGISLQRLLAVLGGSLSERLGREREEASVAELRFAEQDQHVTALQSELDGVEQRLAELGDVDAGYREALEAKRRLLVGQDDEHGRRVLALMQEHAHACSMRPELREAIDWGKRLGTILFDVERAAANAESNGRWDRPGRGGGLIASMFKHGWLDEVEQLLDASDYVIERFHKELADVDDAVRATDASLLELKLPERGWRTRVLDNVLGDWETEQELQRAIERLARDVRSARIEVENQVALLVQATTRNEQRCEDSSKLLEQAITEG